jgi:hypothetical protein
MLAETPAAWGDEELVALCSPRSLPGIEHFGGNELYGHSSIIKEYAGLDPEKPLPVLIPHGVCPSDTYVSVGEKRAGYPAVFSYPAFRDRVYRRRMRMMVVPSASPFLHALELVNSPEVEREGILFFPAHSIPGVQAEQDWGKLAERLCAVAEDGPVRVCLYWTDVLAGRHRVFTDCGLPVVSAGHNHDSQFVARLIGLLRRHRYAASNSPGSHFFYAVAAGCEFFFVGDLHARGGEKKTLALQSVPASPTMYSELMALRQVAARPGHEQMDLLRRVTAKYLRSDALMTPERMREHIQLCSELDRKGSLFTRGVPAWQGPFPCAWYRWLKERVARLLGRRRTAK